MRYEHGVSLLEMMVTLSMAAILAATAVPGMVNLVQDGRQNSSVMDIVSYLNYARSEAIGRGHWVTVCPSADSRNCLDTPTWESGWIAFADVDGDGDVGDSEAILRVHEALPDGTTFRGGRKRITYKSSGFSTGYNDTLKLCDERGADRAYSVIISNMGRVRIIRGATTCS